MSDLVVSLGQGGGHLEQTERCKDIIRALIQFPAFAELGFYIGINQEERMLQRWYEWGRPQTYLLYRTQSRDRCQYVERELIDEFIGDPRNINRNRGGGGINYANWYNVYMYFKEE